MYLKTAAELGGAELPIPIAQVAEHLEVTPVSASEMMKRLGAQGLVEHVPYKGVLLTPAGVQAAHSVIRRQRLWECFLVDHLQLNWAGVYEMACRLEHATSNVVAEALANYLGHPQTCPHGKPIPGPDGSMPASEGLPLSKLPIGQWAEIQAIVTTRTDVFAYLQQRNLLPGRRLRIVAVAPLQGPLTVETETGSVTLGQALAEFVHIRPVESHRPANLAAEPVSLDQLKPGERATVVHVGGKGALRRRYLEMGLVRGETIVAERVAPLGDPVEYLIKGYHLSLRHEEAQHIQVIRQ